MGIYIYFVRTLLAYWAISWFIPTSSWNQVNSVTMDNAGVLTVWSGAAGTGNSLGSWSNVCCCSRSHTLTFTHTWTLRSLVNFASCAKFMEAQYSNPSSNGLVTIYPQGIATSAYCDFTRSPHRFRCVHRHYSRLAAAADGPWWLGSTGGSKRTRTQ